MRAWGYGVTVNTPRVTPRDTSSEAMREGSTTVNVAVRAVPAGCNPRPTATLLPAASLSARPDEGTRSIGSARSYRHDHREQSSAGRDAGSNPASSSLPLTFNRRQFFTIILIAPLIRVYRAKDALSLSELVSITLKRYAPALKEYLFHTNELYTRIKETL